MRCDVGPGESSQAEHLQSIHQCGHPHGADRTHGARAVMMHGLTAAHLELLFLLNCCFDMFEG